MKAEQGLLDVIHQRTTIAFGLRDALKILAGGRVEVFARTPISLVTPADGVTIGKVTHEVHVAAPLWLWAAIPTWADKYLDSIRPGRATEIVTAPTDVQASRPGRVQTTVQKAEAAG